MTCVLLYMLMPYDCAYAYDCDGAYAYIVRMVLDDILICADMYCICDVYLN